MIRVSDLKYRYRGNLFPTLDGINLTVADGELVAIVGQNGSGKSTLGRLIAGIYKLQEGSIEIDSHKLDKKSSKLPSEVGIVFQNPENQIIFNRIDDEVSFAMRGLDPAETSERVSEALAEVGMSKFREQDLYSLSLGQKQRIIIAEVLARRPKHLILDEPTTMIDSEGKEQIYQIIRRLKKQGYTIICITNLADEILLADRTLILADGKIAAEIRRSELVAKAPLLSKYGIHQPTLLKILTGLTKRGIKLELQDWTAEELATQIGQMVPKPSSKRGRRSANC